MKTKRAIKLAGSDEIFEYPNEEIEESVLEKILEDAIERKVDKKLLIIITHSKRVSNFNSDNPRYKNVKYQVPLKELFKIYEKINDEPYRQPTFEEKEQRLRSQIKGSFSY